VRGGIFRGIMLSLLLSALAAPAVAGTACSEKRPTPETVRKALDLGLKTRTALDASGASVVIIGRIGSDLSEYGLRYSHAGFVWRDHPSGRWRVVHMLNQCGTPNSDLFVEGLGNFFLDDPLIYEALLVIPSVESQARIAGVLGSESPRRLYEPKYSLIANPWATRYQNSNQWILEVTAAASSDAAVASRADAQSWLRTQGYAPSVLVLPPLKRLGARMFAANTRFDDHTNEEWSSSRYNVVSVESVERFVRRIDAGARSAVVLLD
jgi:hypothetical protein